MPSANRLTIRGIDRDTYHQVQMEALKRRVPVGQLVSEILRAWLDDGRKGKDAK